MSSDYVGTTDAARILGVSEASVRRFCDIDLLEYLRVGNRRIILLSSVAELKVKRDEQEAKDGKSG